MRQFGKLTVLLVCLLIGDILSSTNNFVLYLDYDLGAGNVSISIDGSNYAIQNSPDGIPWPLSVTRPFFVQLCLPTCAGQLTNNDISIGLSTFAITVLKLRLDYNGGLLFTINDCQQKVSSNESISFKQQQIFNILPVISACLSGNTTKDHTCKTGARGPTDACSHSPSFYGIYQQYVICTANMQNSGVFQVQFTPSIIGYDYYIIPTQLFGMYYANGQDCSTFCQGSVSPTAALTMQWDSDVLFVVHVQTDGTLLFQLDTVEKEQSITQCTTMFHCNQDMSPQLTVQVCPMAYYLGYCSVSYTCNSTQPWIGTLSPSLPTSNPNNVGFFICTARDRTNGTLSLLFMPTATGYDYYVAPTVQLIVGTYFANGEDCTDHCHGQISDSNPLNMVWDNSVLFNAYVDKDGVIQFQLDDGGQQTAVSKCTKMFHCNGLAAVLTVEICPESAGAGSCTIDYPCNSTQPWLATPPPPPADQFYTICISDATVAIVTDWNITETGGGNLTYSVDSAPTNFEDIITINSQPCPLSCSGYTTPHQVIAAKLPPDNFLVAFRQNPETENIELQYSGYEDWYTLGTGDNVTVGECLNGKLTRLLIYFRGKQDENQCDYNMPDYSHLCDPAGTTVTPVTALSTVTTLMPSTAAAKTTTAAATIASIATMETTMKIVSTATTTRATTTAATEAPIETTASKATTAKLVPSTDPVTSTTTVPSTTVMTTKAPLAIETYTISVQIGAGETMKMTLTFYIYARNFTYNYKYSSSEIPFDVNWGSCDGVHECDGTVEKDQVLAFQSGGKLIFGVANIGNQMKFQFTGVWMRIPVCTPYLICKDDGSVFVDLLAICPYGKFGPFALDTSLKHGLAQAKSCNATVSQLPTLVTYSICVSTFAGTVLDTMTFQIRDNDFNYTVDNRFSPSSILLNGSTCEAGICTGSVNGKDGVLQLSIPKFGYGDLFVKRDNDDLGMQFYYINQLMEFNSSLLLCTPRKQATSIYVNLEIGSVEISNCNVSAHMHNNPNCYDLSTTALPTTENDPSISSSPTTSKLYTFPPTFIPTVPPSLKNLSNTNVTADNIDEVLKQLLNFTMDSNVLTATDMSEVADVMVKCSMVKDLAIGTALSFMANIDLIFNAPEETFQRDRTNRDNAAARILKALPRLVLNTKDDITYTTGTEFGLVSKKINCGGDTADSFGLMDSGGKFAPSGKAADTDDQSGIQVPKDFLCKSGASHTMVAIARNRNLFVGPIQYRTIKQRRTPIAQTYARFPNSAAAATTTAETYIEDAEEIPQCQRQNYLQDNGNVFTASAIKQDEETDKVVFVSRLDQEPQATAAKIRIDTSKFLRPLHGRQLVTWWNTEKLVWSGDDECKVTKDSHGILHAECNHLTDFTLIIDGMVRDPCICDKPLIIIGYIINIASVVSLTTMILILLMGRIRTMRRHRWVRRLVGSSLPRKNTRSLVYNLTLLIFYLTFTIFNSEDVAGEACNVFAAISYVLFTSCILQTIFQAVRTVRLFYSGREALGILLGFSTHFPVIMTISFGAPSLLAILLYTLTNFFNRQDGFCWVRSDFVVYAIVIPLSVLLINALICTLLVLRKLFWATKTVVILTRDHLRQRFVTVLLMQFTLGMPWILQYLAVFSPQTTAWHYLFTIVNGSQGVLIFVLWIYRRWRHQVTSQQNTRASRANTTGTVVEDDSDY